MSYNRTIKNRTAKVNKGRYPSVVDYANKITEWRRWPGRIIDGYMFVEFHGHWTSNKEFLELQPLPNPSDFKMDLTNVDKKSMSLK